MNIKPTSSSLPHYAFLDALRGIAATGVVLVHSALAAGASTLSAKKLTTVAWSGQRGVQLFYVVSAFTIFLSLDSRSPNETSPTRNFFIRRFFRIAPLYYLAILLNLSMQHFTAFRNDRGPETTLDLILAATFTHGLSPTAIMHGAIAGWSIGVECIFYLFAPFVFARVTDFRRALILVLCAGAFFPMSSFILCRFFHSEDWLAYLWFLSPGIEMPVFCFGIMAYFVWKARGTIQIGHHKNASLLLLAVAAEMFASSLPDSNATLLWSSLAFVPLLLALSLHPWSAIVNRVTVGLGKVSYSIYLLHFIPLCFFSKALLTKAPHLAGTAAGILVLFLAAMVATYLLAALSYRLIERPGIRLGKALILSLENRGASGEIRKPVLAGSRPV
jgi:peptidoglycan/LPS O-acetylase OafA/YrhL